MSRRSARTSAYQLIFEYLFTRELDQKTYEKMIGAEDITDADVDYIKNIVDGVHENYDELIQIIADNSKNFRLDIIFKPDLAALLLATYEMKYMDDIPMPVSVSEVLELVKSYSTEKSASFVNGVLAGIYKSLKKE